MNQPNDDITDIDVINKLYENIAGKNSVQRFIVAFKHDCANRYGFMQTAESKNMSIKVSPRFNMIKKSKSFMSLTVLPKDGRKYKEQTLTNVLDAHTFAPRVLERNASYAKKKYDRVRKEMLE